jgi:adenylate kinase
MASRRICAANGHVYNIATNPPQVPGSCDLDGSSLIQREDDREETVRARMAQQILPLRQVVEHYRATGVLRTIDGLRPIDEVTSTMLAATDRELGAV